jgi:hypothetical protein
MNEALEAAMANAANPPKLTPGLGDAVAAATKAVGVKPCGGCRRRQEAMNRATPGWASRLLGRLGFGAPSEKYVAPPQH